MFKLGLYWGLMLVLVTGCTRASITLSATQERQTISGNISAPPPFSEVPPTYILYVCDISYSNTASDPNGLRQAIFDDILNSYKGNGSVYFGIITFSDEPYIQTVNFTNDLTTLFYASENLNATLDGGNFGDTLHDVSNYLSESLAQTSQAKAQISQYYVFFISTGIPNIGVSDPNSIYPFVEGITSYMAPRVAHFEFDTAFLGYLPANADPAVVAFYAQAQELLAGMALAGNGTTQTLGTTIPTAFNFPINITPISREYSLQYVYATNINASFGEASPMVDSDADGIPDTVETTLGSNPLLADTDGDGYRDGIEIQFPNTLHLLTFDPGCKTGTTDTDGDNLYDCEESLFGTSPTNPDSNGNYILDGDETLANASALNQNPIKDSDQDGYTDAYEVVSHTQVLVPNTAADISEWGYTYKSVATPATVNVPEQVAVTIGNLSMNQTAAFSGGPVGENLFKIVAAFARSDGVGPPLFYEAYKVGNYTSTVPGAPTLSPAGGVFTLSPNDVSPLPTFNQ